MSDYTPTAEEVRECYRSYIEAGKLSDELFDRWLAEVKAQQDKETTDRIIALLEATYIQDDEEHSIDNCLDEYCPICDTAYSISGVIALIKGENNE